LRCYHHSAGGDRALHPVVQRICGESHDIGTVFSYLSHLLVSVTVSVSRRASASIPTQSVALPAHSAGIRLGIDRGLGLDVDQ